MLSELSKLILSVLMIGVLGSTARAASNLGETVTVQLNEPLPRTPDGTIWQVEYLLIVPSLTSGKQLLGRLKLVAEDSISDPALKNAVKTGGYLMGSNGFDVQIEIVEGTEKELALFSYSRMIRMLTQTVISGYHTRSTDHPEELPKGFGYEWKVIGYGPDRLVPNADRTAFVKGRGMPKYRFERINHELPIEAKLMWMETFRERRHQLRPAMATTCESFFATSQN